VLFLFLAKKRRGKEAKEILSRLKMLIWRLLKDVKLQNPV